MTWLQQYRCTAAHGTVVDAYTGRTIAQNGSQRHNKGTAVLFGGQPMVVVWVDKYRFGLDPPNAKR